MSRISTLLRFFALFLLSLSLLDAEPTEAREWTSKSGHKLEGRALAVTDGKVQFEREGGTKVVVDLDKLSDDDQEILRDHFEIAEEEGAPEEGEAPPEGEAADDLPYPQGKVTEEIQAGGDWTYFLYLPESLRKGAKHPVIFVMNPGGGGAGTVNRYIKGAERNRWIIAVSKQSKNSFDGSQDAVDAMIEHVTDELPIDEDRMYTSGFSGGSRMAFATSQKHKDIAGVIACGAGGDVGSKKQAVYGLCGSNCFNRTDMAISFKGFSNKDNLLRYFPGKHVWAGDEMCDDAITHLNGAFLIKNARKYPEAHAHYVHQVMELVKETREETPMRAAMWTSFLTEHKVEAPGLDKFHGELIGDPINMLYVEGLTEVSEFAQKIFGNNPVTEWKINEKDSAACLREAKKYDGSPWAEVLELMSKDAQKF